MPTLSFQKTKKSLCIPIAIVKGGDLHNQILYLYPDDNEVNITKQDRLYQLVKGNNNAGKHTLIDLPDDSMFYPLPDASGEHRQVYYITGASGSGKSYMARMLCEAYMKMYPDRQVYLISKLEQDDTLDNTKPRPPQRINYETFVSDPPHLEEFENAMVIFDDYDTISGKLGDAIQLLIDDIAIQGRHYNITLCALSHYLTNYKKTRLLLNEATHVVIYPQATSAHALRYLLQTHIGMEKKDIQQLKKLGRWVLLHKNYPQYILSKNRCQILHQD